MQINAIVLRAAGINCDMETQYALELAGASAQRIHINRVIEDKQLLDGFEILVIPGGFSYGDDVAAGKILANQIVHHLSETLRKFIDDGKLILGICNGFQVLVKAGILPGFDKNLATESTEDTESFKSEIRNTKSSTGHLTVETNSNDQNSKYKTNHKTQDQNCKQQATNDEPRATNPVTITNNDSGRFEDRWVYLAPQTKKCVFIEHDRQIYLPIAHGEGKVVTKDTATLDKLKSDGHIAFKYVDENGSEGPFPINPNGSMASIAGLTDTTGRVLGLMPHPERFVRPTQHPRWCRLKNKVDADGMTIFNNAVKYVREKF
jgi:phosphoribosylformylglycinamidine synthase I